MAARDLWVFDRKLLLGHHAGLLGKAVAMRALVGDRHAHVLSLGRHLRERETQRVGPKRLDQIDRVDAVALALAHDAAVAVEHDRVDVDLRERHAPAGAARRAAGDGGQLPGPVKRQRHHGHARDPERNDPAAGAEHVGGEEEIEVAGGREQARGNRERSRAGGLFCSPFRVACSLVPMRPAERAHRPEGGTEPCVEDVGVLFESGFVQQGPDGLVFPGIAHANQVLTFQLARDGL